METFAEYILKEKDLIEKMEIIYYCSERTGIYFNKSVIFKTEIARMFMKYKGKELKVDKNLVLTASLLCNCKKIECSRDKDEIHAYAKNGANYLRILGFSKKFCRICEGINRYSNLETREKESDILELVDQFGGMLLDRPERKGFDVEDALVLMQYRNLKDYENIYINEFIDFVNETKKIELEDRTGMNPFIKLVQIYNESPDIKEFIKRIEMEYNDKIEEKMLKGERKSSETNPNRALFTKETTKKILDCLYENDKLLNVNEE